MKFFEYLKERRKRIKIPKRILVLSIFLILLPFINLVYLGFSYRIPMSQLHKIPANLSLGSNLILLLPFLIAIGLIRVKKYGWYAFLIYACIVIIQNIYSITQIFNLQNLTTFFRTFFWIAIAIYFSKKDLSAPYFKMYPRGWRGEKRKPVEIKIKITEKEYLTADLSLSGLFVFYPNCPYILNEEIEIELTFNNSSLKILSGIVRIDENGIGIAFRNLNKENRAFLKEFLI
ncbi:MAG: PilZ domain-containing protein [Leptospiraceae bacterium]|nr:PilZ domain-containing protein [Leptospiraceae bacterium]